MNNNTVTCTNESGRARVRLVDGIERTNKNYNKQELKTTMRVRVRVRERERERERDHSAILAMSSSFAVQ